MSDQIILSQKKAQLVKLAFLLIVLIKQNAHAYTSLLKKEFLKESHRVI